MQDQMQLLLKASESLSELYSHDFYPPPPPMNTSFPASQSPSQCQHSSHKWEQKTYQLLFSREMERSDWDQERVKLKQENDELQEKLVETRETLVRLMQDVNRVQSSFLIMNGSVKQGYDQLQLKCDNLEESINLFY